MAQPFDADEDVRDSHFDKVTIKIASDDVVRNQWSRGDFWTYARLGMCLWQVQEDQAQRNRMRSLRR
jgi:hypothetical protein